MQSQAARDQLARWGIPPDVASAAGLFEAPNVQAVYPEMQAGEGIIIPYYTAAGELLTFDHGDGPRPFARVRWLGKQDQTGFVKRKAIRYTQPSHTGPQIYLCPLQPWQEVAADPRIPIIITEGEAKAIAGMMHGFRVMALGGVYSFSTPGGQLLPVLAQFQWTARHVFVVFDSDAATNPNVVAAEARLVAELQGKRGSHCHIVRLPAAGAEKVGLDDYLLAHGPDAFEKLLESAPSLSGMDARIIAMNERYAWIEQEAMVFDNRSKLLIRKDSFTNGSESSAEKIMVLGGPKSGPKEVSIAEKWLKHSHAQRYGEVLFRPGEGVTVQGDHGLALNLWDGWQAEAGDVAPWLRLNEYLFSRLAPELRELPLKLWAYKAQNPQKKVPLALVLVGLQGSGKTVWADSLGDAFDPYRATPSPKTFGSEFQGWLEKSIIATIHEMRPEDIRANSEMLKSLISDLRRPMNEKYRPVREINSYTQFIITSNNRGVGAFASDDRRMIVVDCPPPGPERLYDDVWLWREQGGGRKLLSYLLGYDLKGWTPPKHAPMTPEKYLATQEAQTPVQRLAEEMKNADQHIIVQWLDAAVAWAGPSELSNNPMTASRARAVMQSVQSFQIRPWYTPEELAMMFPAIVENLLGSKYAAQTPAGMVSRQLREAGCPYLVNRDDPKGFRYGGQLRQYIIVAQFDEWDHPITQADFDRAMSNWPTYGALKRGRRAA